MSVFQGLSCGIPIGWAWGTKNFPPPAEVVKVIALSYLGVQDSPFLLGSIMKLTDTVSDVFLTWVIAE